ncbi:YkyA family protein [Halalkalibacter okhensis]|uniref:Lipoprotein n=1 Tax=Halalkalibacter okhensis TaxID=333138 RepID=A0A0B0IE77_9BACI|nr:YkyA family protein [Halalkalibacter okhensis]KHF40848.1 hypothetical protein LQ50_07050 [Halalkalibacter okhensis]
MVVIRWGILVIVMMFFLTGCGENPAESVYQHLETAVELELPFEQQQEPLQKAEIRENELFEEIVTLGMNEYEEIVLLAEEALSSINSRESMLLQEKESIEESYQEFLKIEEQLEDIDGEVLILLKELQTSMTERYDYYQQLHDRYSEAIQLDKSLFEMLQQEDLTMEELQEQIDKVNDIYEKVVVQKEKFNDSTDTYNELKREFYKKAELNVQYD